MRWYTIIFLSAQFLMYVGLMFMPNTKLFLGLTLLSGYLNGIILISEVRIRFM